MLTVFRKLLFSIRAIAEVPFAFWLCRMFDPRLSYLDTFKCYFCSLMQKTMAEESIRQKMKDLDKLYLNYSNIYCRFEEDGFLDSSFTLISEILSKELKSAKEGKINSS